MATNAKPVRARGPLGELGVPRFLAIAAVLIVALALQSTLLTKTTFLGVIPQLVLVSVVSLAYLDGPRMGVLVGFFGGLLMDLQLPPGTIAGIYALVYTLIGFGVGSYRQYSTSESVWTPVFLVAIGSALAEAGYALLSIMLGERWVSLTFTAKVLGLVVLYDTLLTPFVFPVIRRVAARFRPEKVHRW